MEFVLLKINDVNYDGSIRISESGNESVIIRIQRRMDPGSGPPPPPDGSTSVCTVLPSSMETVATQTDRCEDVDLCYDEFYNESTFVEVPLTELDLGMELEAEEDLNRTLDFEYEEVTLTRQGVDQKVGLTLCYSSASDEITDIFVGEIDPVGIAAKDGRIRVGDQLLQINGCDVHTRQEAIAMFSDSKTSITLLLARPAIQMDDGFMEICNSFDDLRNRFDGVEDQGVLLGPVPSKLSSNQKNCHVDNTVITEFQRLDRKSAATTIDDVKRDQVIPHPSHSAPRPPHHHQGDGGTVRATDFDRSLSDFGFTTRPIGGGGGDERTATTVDIDSEIDALNDEMRRIQLQYQEVMTAHRAAAAFDDPGAANDQATTGWSNCDAVRSPRVVPRMGTRLDYIRQLHLASEHLNQETSSSKSSPRRGTTAVRGPSEQDTSAYNTGESCRSTPAAAVELLRAAEDGPDTEDCGAEKATVCFKVAEEATGTGSGGERSRSRTSQTTTNSRHIESLQRLYNQYIDVMYTNKTNLQHTIMVQQNLFQQQLARSKMNHRTSLSPGKTKGAKVSDSGATSQTGDSPGVAAQVSCPSGVGPQCGAEMEWVVKRRADGSRYITRRPVRNRMLKERARKVAEERCGLTTDDDAISELKIGRYWSKEERKNHLEKARNHRRQKELLRQQMDNIREKPEVRKELSAVELGHRKHLRHKSKKALDDFTTIQELLVHGSRDVHGKTYNALLSVTTV